MLIILEIIMTIIAWRRGWKWRALLPSAIILGSAFILGLLAGAIAGPNTKPPEGFDILFDVVDIAVLIIMVVKSRQAEKPLHDPAEPIITAASENGDYKCPDCGASFPGTMTLSWHHHAIHGALHPEQDTGLHRTNADKGGEA